MAFSSLPSPDDVTSFLLHLVFGQGIIVAVILSIKALYGWYVLASHAAETGRKAIVATREARERLRRVRFYGLLVPVIALSSFGTIVWIWAVVTLIHKQIAAGGAHSAAPYGLFALLLGIAGVVILWVITAFTVEKSGRIY
jgi:hypothetical protein